MLVKSPESRDGVKPHFSCLHCINMGQLKLAVPPFTYLKYGVIFIGSLKGW